MRTIDDLQAEFAVLERQAGVELRVPLALRASQPPARRPRRVYLPVLVAVVAVAAVTASVTLIGAGSSAHHQGAANTPYPASLPAASYAFSVGPLPDGLQAHDFASSTTDDLMTITSSDGKAAGIVTVVSSTAWHPAVPSDAVLVTVGGQSAYYGRLAFDQATDDAPFPAGPNIAHEGVLWHDPTGLWAYVADSAENPSAVALTQLQLVAIANATQIGTAHPAKMPIKLSYLPTGFALRSVYSPSDPSGADDPPSETFAQPGGSPTDSDFDWLDVEVLPADTDPSTVLLPAEIAAASKTVLTVGEFSGNYSPDAPTVLLTNGKFMISFTRSGRSVRPGGGISEAELTTIVHGITTAGDLTDRSTWFDAAG
jgi:hypothetical protein